MIWPFPRKKKIEPKFKIRKIYTDKFGNNWHEFESNLNLPASRAIAAEIATKHTEFNITPQLFREMFVLIKAHANKGEIVEAFHLIEEIEIRTEMIGEEQTLLDLACCYYLLNDENPNSSGQEHRIKKLEILDKDKDARGFFLERSFEATKDFSNISKGDILKYLKAQRPAADRLELLISKKKSRNTLIRSTD